MESSGGTSCFYLGHIKGLQNVVETGAVSVVMSDQQFKDTVLRFGTCPRFLQSRGLETNGQKSAEDAWQDAKTWYRKFFVSTHPDKTGGTTSSDFILAQECYKDKCTDRGCPLDDPMRARALKLNASRQQTIPPSSSSSSSSVRYAPYSRPASSPNQSSQGQPYRSDLERDFAERLNRRFAEAQAKRERDKAARKQSKASAQSEISFTPENTLVSYPWSAPGQYDSDFFTKEGNVYFLETVPGFGGRRLGTVTATITSQERRNGDRKSQGWYWSKHEPDGTITVHRISVGPYTWQQAIIGSMRNFANKDAPGFREFVRDYRSMSQKLPNILYVQEPLE